MLPLNYVSRNHILNGNMKNVLNGPLVEAPELPMGQLCVKSRPESNGTAPWPQNRNKTCNNPKVCFRVPGLTLFHVSFRTPYPDLYFPCLLSKKLNFGVSKVASSGRGGGGITGAQGTFLHREPKAAQRRSREVPRMSKEVSDLQNCSNFNMC